jgi:hypothetical protein
MAEVCATQLRSLREQFRSLLASRVADQPALPAAVTAINDAMTRVPTASFLLWDEKTGPYRATPHHRDRRARPGGHRRRRRRPAHFPRRRPPDRRRFPSVQPLPAQARPPPVVLHPLRRPRPRHPYLRPPHRDGLTAFLVTEMALLVTERLLNERM